RNAWTALPAGAVEVGPTSQRGAVTLYAVPGQAVAFDALSNQTAATAVNLGSPVQNAHGTYRGAVAAVADVNTNVPQLYSALTHRWHAAPAAALAEMPWVFPSSALLRTGLGVAAFA